LKLERLCDRAESVESTARAEEAADLLERVRARGLGAWHRAGFVRDVIEHQAGRAGAPQRAAAQAGTPFQGL